MSGTGRWSKVWMLKCPIALFKETTLPEEFFFAFKMPEYWTLRISLESAVDYTVYFAKHFGHVGQHTFPAKYRSTAEDKPRVCVVLREGSWNCDLKLCETIARTLYHVDNIHGKHLKLRYLLWINGHNDSASEGCWDHHYQDVGGISVTFENQFSLTLLLVRWVFGNDQLMSTFCLRFECAGSDLCLLTEKMVILKFFEMVKIFPHFWGKWKCSGRNYFDLLQPHFRSIQFNLLRRTVVLLTNSAICKSHRSPTSVRFYVKLAFD